MSLLASLASDHGAAKNLPRLGHSYQNIAPWQETKSGVGVCLTRAGSYEAP